MGWAITVKSEGWAIAAPKFLGRDCKDGGVQSLQRSQRLQRLLALQRRLKPKSVTGS